MVAKAFQVYAWIKACIASIDAYEGVDYLVYGSPSAGKTTLGSLYAQRFLERGPSNKVIILVPSSKIARQWRDGACERWGFDLTINWNGEYTIPNDVDGIVMTYQKLSQNAVALKRFCNWNDCAVIFDEVHHLGADMSWANAAETAFDHRNVKFRLALSGTPYRSDGKKIPWFQYDEDGIAIPNTKYSYVQGIVDKICRAVQFDVLDGNFEWRILGEEEDDKEEATFETQLSKKKSRQRLNTALDLSLEWGKEALTKSIERLNQVKVKFPNSALLVVTKDTKHAKKVSKYLSDAYPSLKVKRIHTESCDDPQGELDAFEESTDEVCVCVGMVTEGVDIPRIRVGCYLSNKLTKLFFEQVVHRGTRRKGDEDRFCYWIIPKDPALEEHAWDFQKQRVQAVELEEKLVGQTQTPDKTGTEPSSFIPLKSKATSHDIFSPNETSHDRFTDRERKLSKQFLQDVLDIDPNVVPNIGNLCRYLRNNPSQFDYADADDGFGDTMEDMADVSICLDDRKKIIKNDINMKINRLAIQILKLPPEKIYQVHHLRARMGYPKQEECTEIELKEKKAWVEDKLANGFNGREQAILKQMEDW